jgi:hypothetical protein
LISINDFDDYVLLLLLPLDGFDAGLFHPTLYIKTKFISPPVISNFVSEGRNY